MPMQANAGFVVRRVGGRAIERKDPIARLMHVTEALKSDGKVYCNLSPKYASAFNSPFVSLQMVPVHTLSGMQVLPFQFLFCFC